MSDRNPGPLTRQELYDRIRKSGKDEYILSEMKRLGFWEQDTDKPTQSEALIRRRSELQQQLNTLLKQQRQYEDPETALKAMRKEQMAAAREKRAETSKKKADERFERAQNWHEQQQSGINWLGEAVSLGLRGTENDPTRLENNQLPVFSDHAELAEAMGIPINELRFLSYQRQTSKVCHYQHFQIAKKQGGYRYISAPMPRLKRVQYWILDNILNRIPLHDAAHGFVAGRSIMSNAQPHVGKAVVINLDLKNFFPSIAYQRVKGLFHKAGYSESLATVLGLLCCEPDVESVELDGERWFVQQGERHLPQGAPTSPAISNLLCRSLDRRLQGLAAKYGFTYTRYADDLTFSAHKDGQAYVNKLMWAIRNIVKDEGFTLHPDKTRIMHRGHQQEVTGLVVNDQLSIDRKTLRRFRALIHQIEQSGPEGKSWNGHQQAKPLLRSVLGFANFVTMVNPEKGQPLKTKAQALFQRYISNGDQFVLPKGVRKDTFRRLSAAGKAPSEHWVQAEAKPAPVREQTKEEKQAERKQMLMERQAEKRTEQTSNSGRTSSGQASRDAPAKSKKSAAKTIAISALLVIFGVFVTWPHLWFNALLAAITVLFILYRW